MRSSSSNHISCSSAEYESTSSSNFISCSLVEYESMPSSSSNVIGCSSPSKVNENDAHSSSPYVALQLNLYESRVVSSRHYTRKYHVYQIGTDPHSLIELYNWINIIGAMHSSTVGRGKEGPGS